MAKEKKKIEVTRDKGGYIIWKDKNGKPLSGLTKDHFTAELDEKKDGSKYRTAVSSFHLYKSAVHAQKAKDVLKVLTPAEKIDAQIKKLQEKKQALIEGK